MHYRTFVLPLLIVINTDLPAGAQPDDLLHNQVYCLYRDTLGNDVMGFPGQDCFEACEEAEKTCRDLARLFPDEFGPDTPKGRALRQNPNRQCYRVVCPIPKGK
jgi:hypothetical protein